MTTRVAQHRIVSATLQHKHYDNFTTLELIALDASGAALLIELFSDGAAMHPTWLPPTFAQPPVASVAVNA